MTDAELTDGYWWAIEPTGDLEIFERSRGVWWQMGDETELGTDEDLRADGYLFVQSVERPLELLHSKLKIPGPMSISNAERRLCVISAKLSKGADTDLCLVVEIDDQEVLRRRLSEGVVPIGVIVPKGKAARFSVHVIAPDQPSVASLGRPADTEVQITWSPLPDDQPQELKP